MKHITSLHSRIDNLEKEIIRLKGKEKNARVRDYAESIGIKVEDGLELSSKYVDFLEQSFPDYMLKDLPF